MHAKNNASLIIAFVIESELWRDWGNGNQNLPKINFRYLVLRMMFIMVQNKSVAIMKRMPTAIPAAADCFIGPLQVAARKGSVLSRKYM